MTPETGPTPARPGNGRGGHEGDRKGSPLRVAVIGDYPENPPNLVGGIQAVMYYTLAALKQHSDLELHVVTCEKWFKGTAARGAVVRDGPLTIHYLPSASRIPHTLSMRTLDRWALRRRLQEIAPDVIHAHGQAAAYPLAAFDTGAPTVVTVHGINTHEAAAEARGGRLKAWLRTAIWRATELAVLRRATDLVIICPWVEQFVRPHSPARLHLIENPVHDDFFALDRRPHSHRILFVGSVIHRKGVLELVQAMRTVVGQLPDAHLVIAGGVTPIYQAYGQQVQQTIDDLGLRAHISLPGYLGHAELLAAYGRAALFTLPSWVESSPVALAQALAAGVPVVTTTIGGTEHLVEDGVNGLRVPARDPEALAAALLRLLRDPAAADRYAAAGRHLAAARFTQAVAAARSAEVYRMLGKVGWIGRRIGIEKYREV